jgi:hypothetical protein
MAHSDVGAHLTLPRVYAFYAFYAWWSARLEPTVSYHSIARSPLGNAATTGSRPSALRGSRPGMVTVVQLSFAWSSLEQWTQRSMAHKFEFFSGTIYFDQSKTVDISCLRLTRAGHNLISTDPPRYMGPPHDVLG